MWEEKHPFLTIVKGAKLSELATTTEQLQVGRGYTMLIKNAFVVFF